MSQIEDVVMITRKIESLLDQLGATGRGLHQKITSVEYKLDADMVKTLRWIATMRNKVVHEDGFFISNIYDFKVSSSNVIYQLKKIYNHSYRYNYYQKKGNFFRNILNSIFSKI